MRIQAAILTGRRSKTEVSVAEIDDSVDRIVAGMEGTPMVDSKSKSLVAYHEVGHAVCGTLTPGTLTTPDLLLYVVFGPSCLVAALLWLDSLLLAHMHACTITVVAFPSAGPVGFHTVSLHHSLLTVWTSVINMVRTAFMYTACIAWRGTKPAVQPL